MRNQRTANVILPCPADENRDGRESIICVGFNQPPRKMYLVSEIRYPGLPRTPPLTKSETGGSLPPEVANLKVRGVTHVNGTPATSASVGVWN